MFHKVKIYVVPSQVLIQLFKLNPGLWKRLLQVVNRIGRTDTVVEPDCRNFLSDDTKILRKGSTINYRRPGSRTCLIQTKRRRTQWPSTIMKKFHYERIKRWVSGMDWPDNSRRTSNRRLKYKITLLPNTRTS